MQIFIHRAMQQGIKTDDKECQSRYLRLSKNAPVFIEPCNKAQVFTIKKAEEEISSKRKLV